MDDWKRKKIINDDIDDDCYRFRYKYAVFECSENPGVEITPIISTKHLYLCPNLHHKDPSKNGEQAVFTCFLDHCEKKLIPKNNKQHLRTCTHKGAILNDINYEKYKDPRFKKSEKKKKIL